MAEMEDDFGALIEESLKKKKSVTAGSRVKARVTHVGRERLLLTLDGGLDGMMELNELGDATERPEIKVGDEIEAYVLRADDRVVELGLRAARAGGAAARTALEEAHASGVPVDGHILEVNKGGYVVDVHGMRCFCPLGQMDIRRIEDPATMVGQRLAFRVSEVRGGRDIVLSRRALIEAEQAQKAVETRKRLEKGAHFRGRVVNVKEFGAFVDLGGIEGMVPASELGYGHQKPSDVVRVGQEVDVEVLRIEPGKDGKGERISLSMKALVKDPFETTAEKLPDGTVVVGTVTRIQQFGAFVELVPGVEGLIHVSAFGKRVARPQDVVQPGQVVAVRVENVDVEQRRIGLVYLPPDEVQGHGWEMPAGPSAELRILGALDAVPVAAEAGGAPRKTAAPGPVAREGDVVEATVDKVEPFGLFLKWATGRGLVHASELGVPRNTDLRKQFPVGSSMRVTVLEVRPDGKLRLSKTAVERAEERAETEAYMAKAAPSGGGKGFGTFADLLKKK
ncbi:MAG: S1 RNA-binding domain-containing protein [Deltaproteobacteria bacterium]|nr:S1 RNA-binding domain-containing protein [Deltaproteobacteria bacterium]